VDVRGAEADVNLPRIKYERVFVSTSYFLGVEISMEFLAVGGLKPLAPSPPLHYLRP
jgi:hypothetical protein